MKRRPIATVAIMAFLLAACAEQTDWFKERLGEQPDIIVDPVAVEKIRSDAADKRFVAEGSLIGKSLTETIRQPGRLRWFATLIEANGGGLLYVGTKSAKADDEGAIETDVLFRSPERGTLDIHFILERRDRVWGPKPGTYVLTEELPNTPKTGGDKRSK
jgi:hypothetical protein